MKTEDRDWNIHSQSRRLKRQGTESPLLHKKHGHAYTLVWTSDLQNFERKNNLVSATKFVVICYSRPLKLIQWV